jgi:hypothetical protein
MRLNILSKFWGVSVRGHTSLDRGETMPCVYVRVFRRHHQDEERKTIRTTSYNFNRTQKQSSIRELGKTHSVNF